MWLDIQLGMAWSLHKEISNHLSSKAQKLREKIQALVTTVVVWYRARHSC
ncbi:MAG: hypothetical protein ACJ71O_09145 [Nitrososphaeraceae archaeon]